MPFTDEQVADLYEGFQEVDGKFRDLRERFVLRQFQDAGAREHADHGFSRRLGSLARCIERVFEVLPPDRVDIPDRDETEDAALNIQAFVMNAFGCCENLAWIWVLERGIRENDGSEIPTGRIGLGPKCRTVRRSFSPEFRDYLGTRRAWFDHLKDFRDALAHRIPLYIPPFVVAPEDWDQWKALGDQAMAALLQGDLDQEMALKAQQAELTRFDPVMAHSLIAGPGVVVFHFQLLADFSTIHEIATEFLAELDR
jgi:hypothetical protein